jgi:hypothetical protein
VHAFPRLWIVFALEKTQTLPFSFILTPMHRTSSPQAWKHSSMCFRSLPRLNPRSLAAPDKLWLTSGSRKAGASACKLAGAGGGEGAWWVWVASCCWSSFSTVAWSLSTRFSARITRSSALARASSIRFSASKTGMIDIIEKFEASVDARKYQYTGCFGAVDFGSQIAATVNFGN